MGTTGNPNLTPWDIYVDERKVRNNHCLGFLVIPNTASYLHKLFKCRHVRIGLHKNYVSGDIDWSEFHRGVLRAAMNWIDCFFQHRGARFYLKGWPTGDAKELVILGFLAKFTQVKGLSPPYNIAVLLDFDSSHAKAKIQNTIREIGQISRCYHFDSYRNDCLQCCDLFLGCVDAVASDPTIVSQHATLLEKWKSGDKLKGSECKRLIAGYLAAALETQSGSVYDLRHRRGSADNT